MLVKYHTIKGQHEGPHLLITAGVHGDEWEPMLAVHELLRTIHPNELKGKLTLVPIANESAFNAGDRVGADSLDLARVCPGRENGSVTERVGHELSQLIGTADYYADLHTGGVRLTIWPLAGYLLHSNENVLSKQRAMARAFGLPLVWGTDPSVEGRTLSVARDLSVPAIYVEYLGFAQFVRDSVSALVAGCKSLMNQIGLLDAPNLSGAVRFMAEDPETGSGHLQVCHPSPHDGVFEPVVKVGDEVHFGATLGYVHHGLTGSVGRTSIIADKAGRVVSLRCLPRVSTGDGLAVVVKVMEV